MPSLARTCRDCRETFSCWSALLRHRNDGVCLDPAVCDLKPAFGLWWLA